MPDNNVLKKDGRFYVYNAEVDGRTLPHAVILMTTGFLSACFCFFFTGINLKKYFEYTTL
jgi:hypothetical protein